VKSCRAVTRCPLCGRRPARRTCPALAQDICSVCCGTKRQVEINCPADCVHLNNARLHPAAVVQRQHERDVRFLLPMVQDLDEQQYRLLLLLQAIAARHASQETSPPVDTDVADAAAAAASTLETSARGIIYEHRPTSLAAQRLAQELQRAVRELASRAPAQAGRVERDGAAALRRIERAARDASGAFDGSERAYLDLVARMHKGAGSSDATPANAAGEDPPAPRIIVP
jgi:hypothetical protein